MRCLKRMELGRLEKLLGPEMDVVEGKEIGVSREEENVRGARRVLASQDLSRRRDRCAL